MLIAMVSSSRSSVLPLVAMRCHPRELTKYATAAVVMTAVAVQPITSVAEQRGPANASTTLRYYARWIPSRGQRWADLLDRVATTV